MNEVNDRDEFPRDRTRLCLGEMLLAANTIEQLATSQQLHYNVHVKLTQYINNRLLYINSNLYCMACW